jgi:hypothetical protein
MGAMRIAQTGGYGVLPSPELPNTFLAQAYDLDDAWGPGAGPCFASKDKGGFECCDSRSGDPIEPPILPPAPSPASAPIQCDAPTNWLNQTHFQGAELVDFGTKGIVDMSGNFTYPNYVGAEKCCAICSNATLRGLGCKYW